MLDLHPPNTGTEAEQTEDIYQNQTSIIVMTINPYGNLSSCISFQDFLDSEATRRIAGPTERSKLAGEEKISFHEEKEISIDLRIPSKD